MPVNDIVLATCWREGTRIRLTQAGCVYRVSKGATRLVSTRDHRLAFARYRTEAGLSAFDRMAPQASRVREAPSLGRRTGDGDAPVREERGRFFMATRPTPRPTPPAPTTPLVDSQGVPVRPVDPNEIRHLLASQGCGGRPDEEEMFRVLEDLYG